MRTFMKYILAALAAVFLLSGCAGGGEPVEDPAEAEDASSKEVEIMPVSLEALTANGWNLLAYGQPEDLQTPVPDSELSLQFDLAAGQMYGFAGCNRYFGEAVIDPADGSLTLGPIGKTRMACGSPLDEQEAAYMLILQAAERLTIEDGRLVLFAGDGQVLVYSPGPAVE